MDNSIYVLNKDFSLLGVIDEYVSVIWRPSYSEVGDFELYMGATSEAVALLTQNNFVVRKKDIITEDEKVIYNKVMIIKHTQIVTDVENGDFLCITGRELKFILHQRVVWQQTTLTGTAENAIRQLVTENAIAPEDEKRSIPNLVLGEAAQLQDRISKQVTGEHLDLAITEICERYGYGWDIFIFNNQLVFTIYQGVNRSHSQSERPHIVFSEDFDNLQNTEYQLNAEEYANTALIGGEGEGLERIYTTAGNNRAGLERYEIFVDVRDISQNKGNADEIPLNTYLKLLEQKGNEKLATRTYTEGFSGEVLSDVAFRYGIDFALGDMVTVKNKYGISRNARVLSAIESEDESGVKLIPQFNI